MFAVTVVNGEMSRFWKTAASETMQNSAKDAAAAMVFRPLAVGEKQLRKEKRPARG